MEAIFFLRVIFYTFFIILLVYGGLGIGVLGLGSWIWFLEWGFQLMGFGACGVGPVGPSNV